MVNSSPWVRIISIFFILSLFCTLAFVASDKVAKAQTSSGISLYKSVDKTLIAPGVILTYKIDYTVGSQPINNPKILDPIPNGLFYIPNSAKLNGVAKKDIDDTGYAFINNVATWSLGNLAAGATGYVSFQVEVPVKISAYGSSGNGGNDTTVLQNAINDTATNRHVLYIPASSTHYHTSPLHIPDNARLLIGNGATIEANTGYQESSGDSVFKIWASNVTIEAYGATIVMPKAYYLPGGPDYVSGAQHRHCFEIIDGVNVNIYGPSTKGSGGDGVYIGTNTDNVNSPGYSTKVMIADLFTDDNLRQGMSLISVKDLLVLRSHFTNTNGHAPEAGIDFEPNSPPNSLVNVTIKDSFTSGNYQGGIKFYFTKLDSTTPPVSINVINHTDTAVSHTPISTNETCTMQTSYCFIKGKTVGGTINFTNSKSIDARPYAVQFKDWRKESPLVSFNGLNVQNPEQGTSGDSTKPAIFFMRDQYSTGVIGNVHFLNTVINGAAANLYYYFNFKDSNMRNVEFLPNTDASNGAKNDPYGLNNGSSVTSVDIP